MFLKKTYVIIFFTGIFLLTSVFSAITSAQHLPPETMNALYRIQVVAISSDRGADKAEQYAKEHSTQFGLRAYIIKKENWYKVLLGDFSDKDQANAHLKKIQKVIKDAWIAAPDNDQILSIWENNKNILLHSPSPSPLPSVKPPIPTNTPEVVEEPSPTPLTEQATPTATPELPLEILPTPIPEQATPTSTPKLPLEILPTPIPKQSPPASTPELPLVPLPTLLAEQAVPTVTPDLLPSYKYGFFMLPGDKTRYLAAKQPTSPPGRGEGWVPEVSSLSNMPGQETVSQNDRQESDQEGKLDRLSRAAVPTPHPSQEGNGPTPHPSQEGNGPIPHPSQGRNSLLHLAKDDHKINLEAIVENGDHSGTITVAVVSPDGRFILTGSHDTLLHLWESSSGVKLRSFVGHQYPISSVSFSPDSRYIVSAARLNHPTGSGEIRLWDMTTGEEMQYFRKEIPHLNDVGFSKDGQYIYHNDDLVTWWKVTTGQEVLKRAFGREEFSQTVLHKATIRSVQSRETPYILKDYVIWDTEQQRERVSLNTLNIISPSKISMTPDGNALLVGYDDGSLELWDFLQAERRFRIAAHRDRIVDILVLWEDRRLYSASLDGTIKTWTLDGTAQETFSPDIKNIRDIAFLSDKKQALVLSEKTLTILDIPNRNSRHFSEADLQNNADDKRTDVSGSLDRARCSADGKYIFAFDQDCCHVPILWDVSGETSVRFPRQFGVPINDAAFSPDHEFLVVGRGQTIKYSTGPSKIEVYQLSQTSPVKSFSGYYTGVSHDLICVSFSADGKYLTAGYSNGKLQLINLPLTSSPDNNSAEHQFVGHSGAIIESLFSPNATRIVSASTDGTIRIWGVESGKEIVRLMSRNSREWAIITPDQYYTASNNGIKDLYFMKGLDVFAYEQFTLELYRPDIVLQRLGRAEPKNIQEHHNAYLERLKTMNLTEEVLSDDLAAQ